MLAFVEAIFVDPLDFLLVVCPPWGFSHPPLGPAYLLEALDRRGFQVAFADVNQHLAQQVKSDPEFARRLAMCSGLDDPLDLWDLSAVLQWHSDRNLDLLYRETAPIALDFLAPFLARSPVLLGASIYLDNRAYSIRLARDLHALHPTLPIVFGGPWSGLAEGRDQMENEAADLMVYGEGESILPDRVFSLKQTPLPSRRKELAQRYPKGIKAPWVDVNDLPFPHYQSFDLTHYLTDHICVITSRGCPKGCVF